VIGDANLHCPPPLQMRKKMRSHRSGPDICIDRAERTQRDFRKKRTYNRHYFIHVFLILGAYR
jgi:hypothetical protein